MGILLLQSKNWTVYSHQDPNSSHRKINTFYSLAFPSFLGFMSGSQQHQAPTGMLEVMWDCGLGSNSCCFLCDRPQKLYSDPVQLTSTNDLVTAHQNLRCFQWMLQCYKTENAVKYRWAAKTANQVHVLHVQKKTNYTLKQKENVMSVQTVQQKPFTKKNLNNWHTLFPQFLHFLYSINWQKWGSLGDSSSDGCGPSFIYVSQNEPFDGSPHTNEHL